MDNDWIFTYLKQILRNQNVEDSEEINPILNEIQQHILELARQQQLQSNEDAAKKLFNNGPLWDDD